MKYFYGRLAETPSTIKIIFPQLIALTDPQNKYSCLKPKQVDKIHVAALLLMKHFKFSINADKSFA